MSIYKPNQKPYKKEIKRKRRKLTQEEKEYRIQRIENIIERDTKFLSPMLTSGLKNKKIRQKKRKSCNHSKTIENDGYIICRYCGIKLEKVKKISIIKKIICLHKKTIENNGFIVCLKCGNKFKK